MDLIQDTRSMSVQVSYKKQVVFGLMLLLVILSSIEIISRIVLDQRDSCNQSLPMSGLYEHLTTSELKKNLSRLLPQYNTIPITNNTL